MRARWFCLPVAVAAATAATIMLVAPAGAAADTSYVALGDSYTSASLVSPSASGAPADCTQSAVNYPHLTAQALGLQLHDVSCGGATVSNMTTAQFSDQPPQFDALNSSTSVVTIGIGGNDNNAFISAVAECGLVDLTNVLDLGAPCQQIFGAGLTQDVASDAPNIGAALQRIHQISPNAKVFVVGYPDILPQSGRCYPTIPLSTGDTAFLNSFEKQLNSMLQTEAQANGDTFVDTYTPSIGHDACQAPGVRWVEPLIPNNAAPIHPNTAGEAADAHDVEAALSAAGIG
jgi:hypothetical protein